MASSQAEMGGREFLVSALACRLWNRVASQHCRHAGVVQQRGQRRREAEIRSV